MSGLSRNAGPDNPFGPHLSPQAMEAQRLLEEQAGAIKGKFNEYANSRNKQIAAASEGQGRQATLMTDLSNLYGKADTISLI